MENPQAAGLSRFRSTYIVGGVTMDSCQHVETCKALMQEAANKCGLFVSITDYMTTNRKEYSEITLRDAKGNYIYSNYSVAGILGFIAGYAYSQKQAG